MDQIKQLIENLRAKPHETRSRVTMAASAGITGIIALFWVVATVSSNQFAVNPPAPTLANQSAPSANGLVGAAAAASLAVPTNDGPTLTVVGADQPEATSAPVEAAPTVIPF